MTILFGLAAHDGAVLAADPYIYRIARHEPGARALVPQRMDKVTAAGPGTLVGFAGDVPLLQDVRGRLPDRTDGSDATAAVEALSELIPDRTSAARDRYEDLWEDTLDPHHLPYLRAVVGGVDADGAPVLSFVDRRGRIEDCTDEGIAAVGNQELYLDLCEMITDTYVPDLPPRDLAASFAYGILDQLAAPGMFQVRRPVRIWSVGTDDPAREITDAMAPQAGAVRDAISRSVQTVASQRDLPGATPG